MKASVIICTYTLKRLKETIAAIDSVRRQSYSNFEIIVVVDNNYELLKTLNEKYGGQLRVILNKSRRGLSTSRNIGLEVAYGDIIVFLDDDAVASNNQWLNKLVQHYKDPNVMAVGGRAVPGNEIKSYFPQELYWIIGCTYKGQPQKVSEVRNLIGCNMSFRKEVFKKVGLFDASMGRVGNVQLTGEETQLCIRLKNKIPWARILYDPNAIVLHYIPNSRLSFSYITQRSFGTGYSVALISKLLGKERMGEEYSFLKLMLFDFIPKRILNVFKVTNLKNNLFQLSYLNISLFMVGWGFILGKCARLNKEQERYKYG